MQYDIQTLRLLELYLILVSATNRFVFETLVLTRDPFQELALKSEGLIILTHHTDCDSCKTFRELLFSHPDNIVIGIIQRIEF